MGQRPKKTPAMLAQMRLRASPGAELGPLRTGRIQVLPAAAAGFPLHRRPPDGSPQPKSPFSSPEPGDRGENNLNGALSLCCVFYLIFQRTHSFIIQNRESKLRRNGFLSIRLSAALSNCL